MPPGRHRERDVLEHPAAAAIDDQIADADRVRWHWQRVSRRWGPRANPNEEFPHALTP